MIECGVQAREWMEAADSRHAQAQRYEVDSRYEMALARLREVDQLRADRLPPLAAVEDTASAAVL